MKKVYVITLRQVANGVEQLADVTICSDYSTAIDFFHLEERYEFHKVEALRLCELKAKYPQSTINRLAKFIGKKVSDVKEDIFHERFLKEKDRCFAKLTRDILS